MALRPYIKHAVVALGFLGLGTLAYFGGAQSDLTEVHQIGVQSFAHCGSQTFPVTNAEYAAMSSKGGRLPTINQVPCDTAWQQPLYDTPSGNLEEGDYAQNGTEYVFKKTRQITTATTTYTVSDGSSKTVPSSTSITASDAAVASQTQ